MSKTEPPFRILPRITDRNRHFWEGGRDGKLQFLRCAQDGTFVHPPSPFCPTCLGKDLAVEAVSGRATVATFSVNYQPWMPGPELPFVLAIVEIEEDPRVRLTTNIVGCDPDDVTIGMPVRVTFEAHDGDVWLPLFEPADGKA